MSADPVAEQFTLNDEESLALSLAKLAIMEADLEGDSDHGGRIVKRDLVRRYVELFSSTLGVTVEGGEQLDWLTARGVASSVGGASGDDVASGLSEALDGYGGDAVRYIVTSPDLARCALSKVAQRQRAIVLLLELVAFYPWPAGTTWERDVRQASLDQLVAGISAPVDSELMGEIDRRLSSTVRRLGRKGIDRKKVAYVAVGGAIGGLLTGGLAAPLIGSAIGGTMGLSGAAATSAGLALLGGGAVSAGGVGVAGGTVVVAGVAGMGSAGLGAAGTWLRGAEADEVVVESAKLEVLFDYVIRRDEQADELQRVVVENLQRQIDQLVEEVNELTAMLGREPAVSQERDQLEQRIEGEQEKRTVLERTLKSVSVMRREGNGA